MITNTLEVGGRIQFDLPESGRFDICATALDDLNGTFGRTNVSLPDLVASMADGEIGVDGILCKGERVAITLKLRLRCRRCPCVIKVVPASDDYKEWFYYGATIREPATN